MILFNVFFSNPNYWEPAENLDSCKNSVKKFFSKYPDHRQKHVAHLNDIQEFKKQKTQKHSDASPSKSLETRRKKPKPSEGRRDKVGTTNLNSASVPVPVPAHDPVPLPEIRVTTSDEIQESPLDLSMPRTDTEIAKNSDILESDVLDLSVTRYLRDPASNKVRSNCYRI